MYSVYYITCKVTISLSLFRYTFVHSISSVYFPRAEVPGTHTRTYILSHGVINRTVTCKEKNDYVNLSVTIDDIPTAKLQMKDNLDSNIL